MPWRIDLALEAPAHRPVSPPVWLHDWGNGVDVSGSLQIARLPAASGYLLRALDFCDFHIDVMAGSILVDPLNGLDPHTLEHLLIDQAMPRLLAGQGQLVVHASLVRIASSAALFLGCSGWGKSTLAGLLHRRGHTALCDDSTVLELRNGLACATPAYPGLRLYQDSIEHAFDDAPAGAPVSGYSSKQRVSDLRMPSDWLGAQPIRAIYLLDDPARSSDAITLAPLTSAEACMALVEHSFRLDPTNHPQTMRLLQQAGALVQGVPVNVLRYPRDFAGQDALVDAILHHFDGLALIPA